MATEQTEIFRFFPYHEFANSGIAHRRLGSWQIQNISPFSRRHSTKKTSTFGTIGAKGTQRYSPILAGQTSRAPTSTLQIPLRQSSLKQISVARTSLGLTSVKQ